jgi:hypothetical protein
MSLQGSMNDISQLTPRQQPSKPASLGAITQMNQYTFLLDDDRGADLMEEAVEAVHDAEACDLAQIRLSVLPGVISIVVMKGGMEIRRVRRPQ